MLDAAIGFWRARLGRPLTDAFRDGPPPMMMRQPPSGTRPGFTPIRISAFQWLADGTHRRSILESVRGPVEHLTTLKLKGGRPPSIFGPFLGPFYYGVAGGLTPTEIDLLTRRHAEQMNELEQRLTETRATLLDLTMAGADPVRVLSIVVRYGPQKGTAVPPIQDIQAADWEMRFPHRKGKPPAAALAEWAKGVPIPIQYAGHGHLPALPRGRRPPGPAEMPVSVAMALLWRHLETTTDRPHREDIAKLFRVWAPWIRGVGYLNGKLVSRRVHRVNRESYSVFCDRLRYEQDLKAAEGALFDAYRSTPH